MTKVRNRRDNACKVLSKQLTQSKQGVDRVLGTLASWTGHQGRCTTGPCSVLPTWPSGLSQPCSTSGGTLGSLQAPLWWGRRSSYEQEDQALLAVLVGGDEGVGWAKSFRRLPCVLLLGKAEGMPTLSLLGFLLSTNKWKSKQIPTLAKPKVNFLPN